MKKAIWEPLTLWGWVRGAIDKRFMGFRKRNGGERSIYMPHVGKKEIAKYDAREKAAHKKFIDSVEREIAVRKWKGLSNV